MSGPFNLYFYNKADADANMSMVTATMSFTVGDIDVGTGIWPGDVLPTSWKLSTASSGSSPTNVVYYNGDSLVNDGLGAYLLYPYEAPPSTCFLEGSTLLCKVDDIEKYVPVEQLTKGTLVKTYLHGYKPVVLVGKGPIQNPGNDERTEQRLYKCSPSNYPQLTDDLYITGCHSILEFPINDRQKEAIIKHVGKLFVTNDKYRLMACVDERAEPWNSEGTHTVWHFALENDSEKTNYGVYANGGLLVETCSINTLKNKSNMSLVIQ